MRWLALFSLIFLVSCGMFTKKSDQKKDITPIDVKIQLLNKFNKYKELVKKHQDENGFILTDECDSLLFSSLLATAIDGINITAAKDTDGKWYRRPLQYPNCYPDGSASEISRDMLMGGLLFMWKSKNLELLEELFDYGKDHNWVMGEGDVSRTYFTPGLQSTLTELIYRLGGNDEPGYRNIPQVWSKNNDYMGHLDLLHLLLRGEALGSLTEQQIELLQWHSQRSPRNALVQYLLAKYTTGDYSKAISILMDAKLFPALRLPTNRDRSTEWLWQRDENSDWEPKLEGDEVEHTGGDFLFIGGLILQEK